MENWKNPPGRSTRKTFATARSVSGTSIRLIMAVAKSKAASSIGKSRALAVS